MCCSMLKDGPGKTRIASFAQYCHRCLAIRGLPTKSLCLNSVMRCTSSPGSKLERVGSPQPVRFAFETKQVSSDQSTSRISPNAAPSRHHSSTGFSSNMGLKQISAPLTGHLIKHWLRPRAFLRIENSSYLFVKKGCDCLCG